MLVGLSDDVSLETGVPNDILEGEGFPAIWASAECVVVVVRLKGLAAVLFSILCIGIMRTSISVFQCTYNSTD